MLCSEPAPATPRRTPVSDRCSIRSGVSVAALLRRSPTQAPSLRSPPSGLADDPLDVLLRDPKVLLTLVELLGAS